MEAHEPSDILKFYAYFSGEKGNNIPQLQMEQVALAEANLLLV